MTVKTFWDPQVSYKHQQRTPSKGDENDWWKTRHYESLPISRDPSGFFNFLCMNISIHLHKLGVYACIIDSVQLSSFHLLVLSFSNELFPVFYFLFPLLKQGISDHDQWHFQWQCSHSRSLGKDKHRHTANHKVLDLHPGAAEMDPVPETTPPAYNTQAEKVQARGIRTRS